MAKRSALLLALALCALAVGANAQAVIVNNNGCKNEAPGPVKELKATPTSPTSVKVTFKQPPGNPCLDYFLVELYELGGPQPRTFGNGPVQSKSYEVVFSGLKPNTAYRTVVTAVSPSGRSSGASTETKTPADPNACPQSLGPVQSLTGSVASSSSGLTLRTDWNPPAGVKTECIAGYRWALIDDKGTELRVEYPYNPSMTINNNVAYGRKYTVRVAAYPKTSSGGKGTLGAASSVTITSPPPPCPTTLPAPVGLTSKTELVAAQSLAVRSNWQPPAGIAANCVKEYVWTMTDVQSGQQIAKATTNGLQMYWSSSIKPTTKYRTRVVAVSPSGQAGNAASVEFTSGPYAVAGRR